MAWEFSVKYDVRMGGSKRSVSICFKALFKKKGGGIFLMLQLGVKLISERT